jgi:tRNA-5-methyluridine54 2-sulfurtransferase
MPKIVYIDQSGKKYDKGKFIRYFEAKVFKTIRKNDMLKKGEKIIIAMSGGKDSTTAAHLINSILSRRGEKLTALLIDEEIPGYRDKTIKDAKEFCKKEGIDLEIIAAKKEFSFGLKQALKKLKTNPCDACGTIRRYLLNKHARKLKADKIATGHNLDDEAQTILMNELKGNTQLSTKLGPVTGVHKHNKFIQRIKPLYFMTEKEVTIYTLLKGFNVKYSECPHATDSFRSDVRELINNLEQKYPGTKNGIVNSFLSILPILRKNAKLGKIIICKSCNEASAQATCSMCKLRRNYKK